MVSNGIFNRAVDNASLLVKNELIIIFNEEAIPKIKELIMDSFRENLSGIVQGSYDSLKIENYEYAFEERLNSFDYVSNTDLGIKLTCPSIETFDFSEGLSLLGSVVNGLDKNYYKVSSDIYKQFTNEDVYNMPDYLVAEDNPFLENLSKDSLDKFEFSMTPPINIMESANNYVKANLPMWIRRAVTKTEMILNDFFDGAIKK